MNQNFTNHWSSNSFLKSSKSSKWVIHTSSKTSKNFNFGEVYIIDFYTISNFPNVNLVIQISVICEGLVSKLMENTLLKTCLPKCFFDKCWNQTFTNHWCLDQEIDFWKVLNLIKMNDTYIIENLQKFQFWLEPANMLCCL